jgi:phage tail sheath protein FI
MSRRHLLLIGAVAASLGVGTLPAAAQSDDGTTTSVTVDPGPDKPGVYVDELPSGASAITEAPTGVTMFVGAGTGDVDGTPTQSLTVGSVADFAQMVQGPSPALQTAVEQYFARGGISALVTLVGDESAPALTAAVSGPVAQTKGWDLLVVPAMGALDTASWTQLAQVMGPVAADRSAIALLDPPASIVQVSDPDWATALAAAVAPVNQSPAAGSMAMLSSPLLLGTQPVSSAAVFAGMLAATDVASGPWAPTGGPADGLGPLEPVATANNAQAGVLAPAGINPIMDLPTSGDVVMGDRTLQVGIGQHHLTQQRTIDLIRRSLTTGLEPYVFQSNDQETWNSVTQAVTSFLTGLWADGALVGDTAAASFKVAVGVPASMSAQDVLNGLLIVDVDVTIEGGPATIDVVQQVQGPG